ncbi:response regulator [Arcticibacter sp. MXS-1]|uniref:response regulator n=1 Tax=Arcticibacter sp. MXS-1 TaxID=3341726 RepID=UPI0035A957CB
MEEFKYKSALLIDDSYIDNLINRKILEGIRFAENIVVMDSPFRAMSYLIRALENNEAPEVIFLDIRMPGMTGFELIQELEELKQKFNSNFKIYMLSSSLDPNDLKQVEDLALVARFIGKPLTAKALEEI